MPCPPPAPDVVPADFSVTVSRWRVENSHGEGTGTGKGYLCMTDRWFDEYNYQVAIDKARLAPELQALFDDADAVVELPPWDPLGALARTYLPSDEEPEEA